MLSSNKHLVIALIVGPVLAILAWFAVGQLLGERAEPAVSGRAYPLLEKSDCRYASGHCKLENQDFKLMLRVERQGLDTVLVLVSDHALEGVMFSVAAPGTASSPLAMDAREPENKKWAYTLVGMPGPEERIRLVASSANSQYFGDASTLFIQRQ